MMQKSFIRIFFSFCLTLIFFGQNTFGQEGNLSITSTSGKFLVLIDNIIQHDKAVDSLHLNHLPEGSYAVKLINTDSLASFEKNVYINQNNHEHYEHFIEDSTAFLRLVGNFTSPLPDSLFLAFKTEQIIEPSSILNQFTDSIQVKISQLFSGNYKGKTGCAFPSLLNINSIREKINDQPFTKRKKDVLIRELRDKCIKVNDLSELLYVFDYEDDKLHLINQLLPYVYDLDNLSQLESMFNLQSNKEAFKNIIAKND